MKGFVRIYRYDAEKNVENGNIVWAVMEGEDGLKVEVLNDMSYADVLEIMRSERAEYFTRIEETDDGEDL